MALIRAFNTAIAGLKNQQMKLDVLGDNIANSTTTAFKGSRVNFKTLLSQTMTFGSQPQGTTGGINPIQIGLGVTLSETFRDFSQGELELTGRNTDMAIEGNGFFILKDAASSTFFTRDGSFALNADSELIDPSTGLKVQGTNTSLAKVTGSGVTTVSGVASVEAELESNAALEDISIPIGSIQIAAASSKGIFDGNLNGGGEQALQGTILESSVMVDVSSGNSAAVSGTLLTNLGRLPAGGGTAIDLSIDSGDIIFVSAEKGGRAISQKKFLVGSSIAPGFDGFGTTLGQFSTFLDRALGINKSSEQLLISAIKDDDNDPNTAGISGSVTTVTGAPVTSISATGVDLTGAAAGDIIRFNTGQGAGQIATIGSIAGSTITFTAALPTTIPQPAAGDLFSIHEAPGAKIGSSPSASGVLRVAGNVGSINDITNLSMTTSDGIQVSSFFTRQSADGESAFANATFFDSLGNAHVVDMSFVLETKGGTDAASKSRGNTFRFFAESEDNKFLSSGNVAGDDRVVGTGTITFSLDGQFLSANPLNSIVLNLNNQGVTTPLTITPNFTEMSGFANSTSEVFLKSTDGFAKGVLNDFAVEENGNIRGIFSNGQTRLLGRVLLARFSNPDGLISLGNNLFEVSVASGDPIVGSAGTLGIGLLRGGVLEASNVDVAKQLTDMIVTQRAYQANTRAISTASSLLEDLLRVV